MELVVQSSAPLTLLSKRGANVQTTEDFYSLLTERIPDIKFLRVSEEDIRRFDEAALEDTLAMHQVIPTEPG